MNLTFEERVLTLLKQKKEDMKKNKNNRKWCKDCPCNHDCVNCTELPF